MQKSGPLELTVIEHFTDMDVVHVHCKRKMRTENLIHPRSLAKLLVDSSEVLKNREYRLYYVVPPSGTVFPLSGAISFDVFFEWHRRSVVNDVYAVVVNRTTPDCKKVVNLYLNQMPMVHYNTKRAEHFKRTVAKPFSHRPMEPEVDSTPDGRFINQQSPQSSSIM